MNLNKEAQTLDERMSEDQFLIRDIISASQSHSAHSLTYELAHQRLERVLAEFGDSMIEEVLAILSSDNQPHLLEYVPSCFHRVHFEVNDT